MDTKLSMLTIQAKSYIGSDGLLHIPLPGLQNTEIDVILVYQPVKTSPKRGWSPEFLSLFGAWEGEPLSREPQEKLEEILTDGSNS